TAINFYLNNATTPVMKRAPDTTVPSTSALAMSVSYNQNFIAAPSTITDLNVDATASLTGRTSKTFFTGGQGDEIADYTVNYRQHDALPISTAINFYLNNATTPVMK